MGAMTRTHSGIGLWTSVLLLVFLVIGCNCQDNVKPSKFDWTIANLSRTLCKPMSSNKCYFVGRAPDCLDLSDEKAKSTQCRTVIAVEYPENEMVNPFFTFRLIGPYVTGNTGSSSRWVGIGFKRLDSEEPNIAKMDNALVIACYRARHIGRDIFGAGLRYTMGNNIRPLDVKTREKQRDDTILNLRIAIVDFRLMCEFQLKAEFPIERPPLPPEVLKNLPPPPPGVVFSATVTFKLKTDIYNILTGYGVYDYSKREQEGIQKHSRSAKRWETESLVPNDCGRIKSCLAKGHDGCGLITKDCPILLRVEPKCNETGCSRKEADSFTFEMESKTGQAVMVGFAARKFGIGTFRLADMGLILSCEKTADGSSGAVVIRMNTCYGLNKTLNETEARNCTAVRLGESLSDTPQIPLKNIMFNSRPVIKVKESWFRCSFVWDYTNGTMASVTLPDKSRVNVTQALEFDKTKYYLAIGALEKSDFGSGVTGGYTTEVLPLPNLTATKLEAYLYDLRADIQLVKEEDEVNDSRIIGTNEKDPNSGTQMASFTIFVLLASAVGLFLTLV